MAFDEIRIKNRLKKPLGIKPVQLHIWLETGNSD
jgi:hypothetical protein